MKMLAPAALLAAAVAGCGGLPTTPGAGPQGFDAATLGTASAAPLAMVSGQLLTDNDAAFDSKLRLVEQAQTSLDLAYYIYGDDYSSSRLTQALIAAARRGVRVRLLVDYATNYDRLDLFSLMQRQGARGSGSLEVRFYGRPTRNVVEDAAFMTMGCSREAAAAPQNCGRDKLARIEREFAGERIGTLPAQALNISNLNSGGSGLFLSGYYAKRPDITAMAVQQGQGVDPKDFGADAAQASEADRARLKRLGRAYWDSRFAPGFARLEGKMTMFFALAIYGEQLSPVQETVSGLLPLDKDIGPEERRDWEHLSDFTHHKLLLADRRWLQMGGRNVEDSYHMRPNPMTKKYVFMDTDLRVELAQGGAGVAQAFDALWDFQRMVASLAEVRSHAPNDMVANLEALNAAQQSCKSAPPASHAACLEREFGRRSLSLGERLDAAQARLERNAAAYGRDYRATLPAAGDAPLEIDAGAALAYLENLPFDKALPAAQRERHYGAVAGAEERSGKHIHDVWYRALDRVCDGATAAAPRRVVLHNAYFFPSADYLALLASLFDGRRDCSNVRITVLTNSLQTTDLNVVNILARHAMKAFVEYTAEHGRRERSPQFEYFEYKAPASGKTLSLHTKLSVFGDDIVIGSANADVRSLMMDSNNAMLIRAAPQLRARYLALVDGITQDAARSRDLLPELRNAPRANLIRGDLLQFDALLHKYKIDRRLDDAQEARLRTRFGQMIDAAYDLARQSLDPAASAAARREAQQRFNDLFQPI